MENDWVNEALELNAECARRIPDFDSTKFCGPNRLIAGKDFDDDIIVYRNEFFDIYFIDQLEPSKTLNELKNKLERIVKELEVYENEGNN